MKVAYVFVHDVEHAMPDAYALVPCDRPPIAYDGVSSDGDPCHALSESGGWRPCPKDSIIALRAAAYADGWVRLCGSHYARHRRGRHVALRP